MLIERSDTGSVSSQTIGRSVESLSPADAIEQCRDIHAIAIASFVRDNAAPMIVTGQTDFA